MTQRAFLFTGWGALGALDVGVFHALSDAGERFDLLAGANAGAVNAAALASGIEPQRLGQAWLEAGAQREGWLGRQLHPFSLLLRGGGVYRLRHDLWRLPRWRSLYQLRPLRKLLHRHLSEEAVRQSPVQVAVLAWNMTLEEPEVFGNDWFLYEHLEASCATPHLFPAVPIERTRYCDPTHLSESSPLTTLALGNYGIDEIVFPLPRLRSSRTAATWSTSLTRAWALAYRSRLERDLLRLRALEVPVPRLVPLEFDVTLEALAPLDYRRASLHRLLDHGYDSIKSAPEPEPKRRPKSTSKKAGKPKRKATRRTPPEKASRAVQRLRKALRDGPKKRRKEPSLGF